MKSFVIGRSQTLLVFFCVLISTLSTSVVQAITWEIKGACSHKPVHEGEVLVDLDKSVGETSIQIFELNNIPYVGNEQGLNSLLKSPIGLDSIDVISDEEMHVYGWCYSVNGKHSESLPNKAFFDGQNDHLTWYYAYSINIRNEWVGYCYPAHIRKSDLFCSH